jgi:hypothetical protein
MTVAPHMEVDVGVLGELSDAGEAAEELSHFILARTKRPREIAHPRRLKARACHHGADRAHSRSSAGVNCMEW